ncbi:MAG: hypothetical protein KAV87_48445, partial [Desulfobacteraceae bacterium]|nr:hypothetical protein [Desulfobacteraceae bacterium]
ANSGGSFAVELKAAGYDGVFFSGISSKPAYLFLDDGQAKLKDAAHLWGKDTVDTEEGIKDELGDKRVKVACIGPTGELKSLSAAIMHEGCAAARSGLGAVMGAKRLKAFATRGTRKVEVADAERVATLRKDYLKNVKDSKHVWVDLFKIWGTCSFFESYLIMGDCPIKNWTRFGEEGFPNWEKLHGDSITKYQTKKHTCLGCPLGCKGWLKVEKGPYAIDGVSKIEYETLGMFGSNLLIDDPEPLIKANDLCNRYGMDTCTVGSVIGFAMECYERGVITKEDTGGIELTWSNAAALLSIVEKIARREGIGAVLADGSKLAAERIGKGSEKWAVHVGGQDLPAHDPRTSTGHGWGYICDPTPGRHTATQYMDSVEEGIPFVMSPGLKLPEVENKLDLEFMAPIFAICSDLDRLSTSAGLCWFGTYPETLPLIEAISAITGWDFTLDEGLKVGRRIQALRQAFNIREGVNTIEWCIPERLDAAPATGPIRGRKIDFKAMKRLGYAALGWNAETGKPLESTLQELGLKELVGQLP